MWMSRWVTTRTVGSRRWIVDTHFRPLQYVNWQYNSVKCDGMSFNNCTMLYTAPSLFICQLIVMDRLMAQRRPHRLMVTVHSTQYCFQTLHLGVWRDLHYSHEHYKQRITKWHQPIWNISPAQARKLGDNAARIKVSPTPGKYRWII